MTLNERKLRSLCLIRYLQHFSPDLLAEAVDDISTFAEFIDSDDELSQHFSEFDVPFFSTTLKEMVLTVDQH